MPIIGLTGGLGTGKSLVSSILAELGAHIIDCDIVAREVVEPGEAGLKKVAAKFGRKILDSDGTLDRKALAKIVFASPEKRVTLEGILHPIIEDVVMDRANKIFSTDPGAIVIVDAAVLFESGLHKRMDKTIVVYCDPETQMERALGRGDLAQNEIEERIAAQWPLSKKTQMADYIIDNSGSQEDTRSAVIELWHTVI